MIGKFGFYHGAAVTKILEHEKCLAVRKKGLLGYIVNDNIFVFLKYTARAGTPWRFTFDQEDVDRCKNMTYEFKEVFVGLVCAGDGVCALRWSEVQGLLEDKPGWISVKRRHREQYAVAGSVSEHDGKISLNRWPEVMFEDNSFLQVVPNIHDIHV